jgi:hypothetical protein
VYPPSLTFLLLGFLGVFVMLLARWLRFVLSCFRLVTCSRARLQSPSVATFIVTASDCLLDLNVRNQPAASSFVSLVVTHLVTSELTPPPPSPAPNWNQTPLHQPLMPLPAARRTTPYIRTLTMCLAISSVEGKCRTSDISDDPEIFAAGQAMQAAE